VAVPAVGPHISSHLAQSVSCYHYPLLIVSLIGKFDLDSRLLDCAIEKVPRFNRQQHSHVHEEGWLVMLCRVAHPVRGLIPLASSSVQLTVARGGCKRI